MRRGTKRHWVSGAQVQREKVLIHGVNALSELKERGLVKPLLFGGDGLKGLREAVKQVYPKAQISKNASFTK
jgi:transposase-like protein